MKQNTVTLLSFCFALACSAATNSPPLLGFTSETVSNQLGWEQQFDAALNREHLRDWMKRLTAHPHHLGSAYDKENAEFIAAQFKAWGYDTQIEEFEVLFPTPKARLLELTAPERFTARLTEPAVSVDGTSSLTAEQLPTYNAYSKDG